MKNITKTLIASAVAFATFSQSHAAIQPLSEVRDQIVFPEYSSEQKHVLAKQAKLLVEGLYVHQYEKDIYYGTSPNQSGHLSPVNAVNQVINNIDNLSAEELNKKLQTIFLSQRDLHLNFNYPQPFASFVSFVPFTFERTTSATSNFEVRVGSTWDGLFGLLPGVRMPQVGDRVISYNDRLVEDVVRENIPVGGGANEFGGFTRAMDSLRLKGHSSAELPVEDSVTIEFESVATGEVHTSVIPWLSFYPDSLATSSQARTSGSDIKSLTTNSSNSEFLKAQEVAKAAGIDNARFQSFPTAEPTVTWNVVDIDNRKLGYIFLESFVPENGVDSALSVIVNLLDNQLAETDALLIDVRNNGGGNITYADRLFQLFTPKNVNLTQARYINTPLNQYVMQNTVFSTLGENWVKLLRDVEGTSQRYTDVSSFITRDQTNLIGQAYYKPVGVWANARTYSSGDLFTCGMQDNGVGTVFGEDPQTGAGGANVIPHSLFAQYAGAPFQALPHGQDMRVSWRQSVRFGHHKNELIEDYGCYSDVDIPLQAQDILDGGSSNLAEIGNILFAQKTSKSTVEFTQPRFIDTQVNGRDINFSVTNTEHVHVYLNGQKVDTQTVYAYGPTAKQLTYTLPDNFTGFASLKFVGVDAGHAPLWNSTRYVR